MDSSDPDCHARGIPDHLHQLGRPVDSEFTPTEALYRRFNPSFSLDNPDSIYAIFTTRRMSVNREKHSHRPEDVLFNVDGPPHFLAWGIAEIHVATVTDIHVPHPNSREPIHYSLAVRHQPERCMYPHCEIEVYANGERIEEIKPSSAKTRIKAAMARACVILKLPSA